MRTQNMPAALLGITPLEPKPSRAENSIRQDLETFLTAPQRAQNLKDFEEAHQLPALGPSPQAPHAREIRYLLTHNSDLILIEAAREITHPELWYALAGFPQGQEKASKTKQATCPHSGLDDPPKSAQEFPRGFTHPGSSQAHS